MTHLLTVGDVRGVRAVYADVLGGRVVMEENACIVRLANGWVTMNLGAGPTSGRPGGCDTRDADGCLVEVGQAMGLVEGRLVEQARAGREAGRSDGR